MLSFIAETPQAQPQPQSRNPPLQLDLDLHRSSLPNNLTRHSPSAILWQSCGCPPMDRSNGLLEAVDETRHPPWWEDGGKDPAPPYSSLGLEGTWHC
jgi:hypothetical protein